MNRLCSTGFSRSPRIFLRSTPRDYRPAFGAIELHYLRRFGAGLIVESMSSRILRSRSIALPKAS
jgi:hypothetical protein